MYSTSDICPPQFLSGRGVPAPAEQSGPGHSPVEEPAGQPLLSPSTSVGQTDTLSLIPHRFLPKLELCHTPTTAQHVLLIQCRHVYQGTLYVVYTVRTFQIV